MGQKSIFCVVFANSNKSSQGILAEITNVSRYIISDFSAGSIVAVTGYIPFLVCFTKKIESTIGKGFFSKNFVIL